MLKIFSRKRKMQEIIITLKIQKQQALRLETLSNAILSLHHSLSSFVEMDKGLGGVELQLKSVEKGSDVFNFLVHIGSLLPPNECISAINAYFELWHNLKTIKQQSIEQISQEKYIDKAMAKDLANIISLLNIGADAQITNNFNNAHITINQNTFNIYSDNLECIAKIKGFDEKIEAKTIFENMLIEFYQTTNTQKPKAHKAYCYNLSKSAKNIFIDDDQLKQEMLENPYHYEFLVDLEVYKDENDRIKTYRAYNYKEKIAKQA